MKKVLVLLAMMLGATNMYAQDYDLQGLAKACKKYSTLSSFHDGLTGSFDPEIGNIFIDKKGNVVFVLELLSIEGEFSEGLMAVRFLADIEGVDESKYEFNKIGYIDKSGNLVIPCMYDKANPFYKGFAYVTKGDKKFYIDKHGKEAIVVPNDVPTNELEIIRLKNEVLSDVLSVECRNGKYGINNKKTGANIIPFIYDDIVLNQEGLIKVNQNGKFGWIDDKGHVVIPIQYDYAQDFSEGLAFVEYNSNQGYVDIYGNSTFNPTAITNTNTNSTPETTESLEKEVKTMWDEANKYIDLANSSETKGEKLNYIKKADALYEKMQNTPNVESVLPLDYIKQYRDTCKQFIEALNAM